MAPNKTLRWQWYQAIYDELHEWWLEVFDGMDGDVRVLKCCVLGTLGLLLMEHPSQLSGEMLQLEEWLLAIYIWSENKRSELLEKGFAVLDDSTSD